MQKRYYLLVFSMFLLPFVGAKAQNFQPLNAGFEQWDGTSNDSEPASWNSFASGDGSFASMASSPHHYRRAGHRTDGTGNYYLVIYTRSILGVKANGNMTTGRIHMGAMSASSDQNYNYTQRSESGFNQPFTATPDSMYVWVSYYAADASSKASVSAFIHGNSDFRDANDINTPSLYAGKAVMQFARTTSSASSPQWVQQKVAFNYSGTATPAYLLMSLTTNMTPGGGSANDSLMVDDIEFIYSAWLDDISLNGTTLYNFNRSTLSYTVYVDSIDEVESLHFTATPQASDATITVDTIDGSMVNCINCLLIYRFRVTAEDGGEKIYTVWVFQRTGGEGIVSAQVESPSVALMPNPAHDAVHIVLRSHGEGAVPVQVVNAAGVTVARLSVNGSADMPTAGLAAGLYIVRTPYATTKLLVR
ncbi:MAG: T9SS type A sorting domain-containing protein [Bacteroidales bacterium]|nr:T9SS type A sorting domain-containing protein [Bacteroidales bacterium]